MVNKGLSFADFMRFRYGRIQQYLVSYITWLDATLDDLQTRPLRQILLYLRNNSLAG